MEPLAAGVKSGIVEKTLAEVPAMS